MTENFETLYNRAERYFIYKTRSGKNLITRKPALNFRQSGLKLSPQKQIRNAATYAEFACDQPIYKCKAVGTSNTAYNLALADYLGRPQVLDIDIRGWSHRAGQTILIQAVDNFLVLRVSLVIRKGDSILEEGEAEQSELDGLIWRYTLQTRLDRKPGIILDAYAYDLPGNAGCYSIELR